MSVKRVVTVSGYGESGAAQLLDQAVEGVGTPTPETIQLRKDIEALGKRNERQFQIIEHLLGELKNAGKDIYVLDIPTKDDISNAADWAAQRDPNDAADESNQLISALRLDMARCRVEIRRLYAERADAFFNTLETNGGEL